MFDVGIIGGGGIVGCAIARELALLGLSVAAVEKHDRPCRETSGLNSHVIHSGFHELPGTLKAMLARQGSELITRYAEEHGIKLLKTGMLIAVPHGSIRSGLWKEASSLLNLWKQGRHQNISFRFIFTPRSVRELAPIRALGGIFIPAVSVIDIENVVRSLEADAVNNGAAFFFENEVTGIAADRSGYVIQTGKNEIRARSLINSAGLSAHEVSRMAGGPAYEVEFLRGDYYELIGGVEKWNIRTLVYPAMPARSRSKGIHFGPRTDGRLYIGPTASSTSEQAPKQLFLDAAQKFLPEVREADLRLAYYGIRPKNKSQRDKSDFIIRMDRTSPDLVNLIGIDSPGLSASMAIAKYVAKMIRKP